MWNPIARLEVNVIEGSASAGPCFRTPTKHTIAYEPLVGHARLADILHFVECIDVDVPFNSTAFEQDDATALASQFPRDRRSCGPAPDHANIRFQPCFRFNIAEINDRHLLTQYQNPEISDPRNPAIYHSESDAEHRPAFKRSITKFSILAGFL